jgi:Tfp pilus assembly protein PilF
VLKGLGRTSEALEGFRTAVRFDPDMAEAHLSLAQVLQQQGDAEGARVAGAEADRLNRRKADSQAAAFAVGVGRQKLESGDRPGAIAQFREAVRLDPSSAKAHLALASALEAAGAHDEARRHYVEAQRLAPYVRGPEKPR